jgi:glycosyltransferase involved in cell wall biosynthesis
LFNALADMPDIDLTVTYIARTDPSRRWATEEGEMRYRHHVLRQHMRLTRGESFVHLTSGLIGELRRSRPQVVVAGGWDQFAYQEAYALRAAFKTRFAWWVESNIRDRRPDSSFLRSIKRRFIVGVDGVIVPGQASLNYVQQLGAPAHRVWVAPNAVDNDFFATRSNREVGRDGPTRFLFVGRLTSSKGLACLLDAWIRVRGDVELLVAGTGPLDALAHSRVAGAAMPPVRLLGHLDREGLAAAYAEADVFVFPSVSDPWGLVINEAMAAGLPVIATSAPGAVDDLVDHNDNGFVVPTLDPGALTAAMQALADDPALRARMGERSRERIAHSRPIDWAEGMRRAVLSAARAKVSA